MPRLCPPCQCRCVVSRSNTADTAVTPRLEPLQLERVRRRETGFDRTSTALASSRGSLTSSGVSSCTASRRRRLHRPPSSCNIWTNRRAVLPNSTLRRTMMPNGRTRSRPRTGTATSEPACQFAATVGSGNRLQPGVHLDRPLDRIDVVEGHRHLQHARRRAAKSRSIRRRISESGSKPMTSRPRRSVSPGPSAAPADGPANRPGSSAPPARE